MTTPTPAQVGTARDALTLTSAIMAGDEDAASALVDSFMRDPACIPGVLAGLVGIVAQALATPEDTAPEAFIASCHALLDEALDTPEDQ